MAIMKKNAFSTLPRLRLTPPGGIPASLQRVHLDVRVGGRTFRRTFEADAALAYTFAWDKRNVYNQKVEKLYLSTEESARVMSNF